MGMSLSTKLIAEPRRLTWGMRRELHVWHPAWSLPVARPIDVSLYGKSSLEILRQSYSEPVCFSPAHLTYDLAEQLRDFQPNDGYHATGLQFITDNLDLIVIDNAERFSARAAEGLVAVNSSENPRVALIQLPASPPWRLNRNRRFNLLLTPLLIRPAAGQFLTRLSQAGEIPRFNNKYQEIRSRYQEIFWLNYAKSLRNDWQLAPSSTETDYSIQRDLENKIQTARQKVAEYNRLLGLAADNLELFPLRPDFSFQVRRFFSIYSVFH
jgi:hypothetical protein